MVLSMDVDDPKPPAPHDLTPRQRTEDASERRVFWVSPPFLHPDNKREYNELSPGALLELSTDEEEETVVEIVGETRLGTDLFFWVEHQDGVVHRYLAKTFKDSHGVLVDAYNEKKNQGVLEEFDPKSSRIHPKDRVNMKIFLPARGRINRAHPSRAVKQKRGIDSEDTGSGSDSEESELGAEYSDESGNASESGDNIREIRLPTRRSTRVATTQSNANYRDASGSPMKPRRNPKRYARVVENDSGSDDEQSSGFVENKPENKKKIPRGRLARPAYGNIRHVADLSDDDFDIITDDAVLHAHRQTCDICHQAPAHELLTQYYKRKKKNAKRRKSRTGNGSDEEAEEERLLALGGWIRCLKCCVTAHWKCIGATQRAEIISAARLKDQEAEALGVRRPKRVTLSAYDTTEFICGACTKGGVCMFCLNAVPAEVPPEKKADVTMDLLEHEEPPRESRPAEEPPKNDTSSHTPSPTIIVSAPTPLKDGTVVLATSSSGNLQAASPTNDATSSLKTPQNLFRCVKCKRPAHYAHLPQPSPDEALSLVDLAQYYQAENEWKCPDCASFVDALDKILAWRPYPANAVEPPRPASEPLNPKAALPREYLVKWVDKSYRHLTWVPHMWLLSTSLAKLKNFLATGPKVQLVDAPMEDLTSNLTKKPPPSFLIAEENSRESSIQPASLEEGPSPPYPDAERRIPLAWKTIDRVLDILLWDPTGRARALQRQKAKVLKNRRRVKGRRTIVDDESESGNELNFDAEAEEERIAARERGERPSDDFLETLDEWEARTGESLAVEHAELVIWAFVKWGDLAYEEATWDSPPVPSDIGWEEFVQAFQRFLDSREVRVPKRDKKNAKEFDSRRKALFEQRGLALKEDPDLGQDRNSKLMDFQLAGVNWLFRNWWRHQPSILADDMGLGKTVQVAVVVGHLIETMEAPPVLIVVPNSTITNWLREFARWAPRLRVVQFNGEVNSRDIIRKYELYHPDAGTKYTNLKFHVLVTTYDTVIGKDFGSVFKSVPRWELLVVDEGQRLKSNSSLLFKKLNELNTIHRILLTGTPLNNNIRELFNLMNFLDPMEWNNLELLAKKYETLTEDLLNELHESLKPYFLRRTKADVLKLPPKNEVIVPVSMTAIQKEVYKSLLSQNVEILGTLAQPSSGVDSKVKKSNLNNLLMQLRKCLQHPYLISRDLEPTDPTLTPSDVHQNLLGASAKLRLLHSMLPKLKERGHRILLFSQFTMALDIIEDFIAGEGHKFLRLDGDTKQTQRQKDMDTFNRPDSDVFIYLLSTRAGGVGINLWSADTVIVFDPDFNPHQDLQAISRAHRYGQTKPVLVFKLMVKGAAEERIVQSGKKKLALDHLIVQKMDDDGATDDVQSILTFGAKAIFEDSESHDITYTDADIDNLIEKTEKEGDNVPEEAKTQSSFGFAKLYVVEKDSMEEVADDAPDAESDGFWGGVLARATAEKAKAKAAEITGRGAKRRAAASQKYNYENNDDDYGSPIKPKPVKQKQEKKGHDDDVEYHESVADSSSDTDHSGPDPALLTDEEQPPMWNPKSNRRLTNAMPELYVIPSPLDFKDDKMPSKRHAALTAIQNHDPRNELEEADDEGYCGLCHTSHGVGSCFMTQNPSNLLDYRLMLMTESDEPISMRSEAVQAIDANLASRGLVHLLRGQPFLVQKREAGHGASLKRPASLPEGSSSHKKAKWNNPEIGHGSSLKHRAFPDGSSSKMDQLNTPLACEICKGPFHVAKKCPVVKQGPQSILQAISRLEQEPNTATIVQILRSHLSRPSNGSSPFLQLDP